MLPRRRERGRIAVRRPEEDRRQWQFALALLLLLTFAFLTIKQATAAIAGAATGVEKTQPQGSDPPGNDAEPGDGTADPQQGLSEQLQQQDGVITPPETGDTGIHAQMPDADQSRTPVIPPPGSPGGDPNVTPK